MIIIFNTIIVIIILILISCTSLQTEFYTFEMPSTKHSPLKVNLLFDDKTDFIQLRKIEEMKITLIVIV